MADGAFPADIVLGSDGALWFTELRGNAIGRLTVDDGGDLWFTQGTLGQVGRVDLKWDPPISAAGTTFTMRRFDSAERTVATFTDPDADARPSDYDVTIKWGDGGSSAGWVRRAGAGFEMRGRHVYDKAKTFAVTVKIDDAEVSSTAVVSR